MSQHPRTHTFQLYSCAGCGRRWWTADDEPNPGHTCTTTTQPMVVTFLAETRERAVPDTQRVIPLRSGTRKHGTDGI